MADGWRIRHLHETQSVQRSWSNSMGRVVGQDIPMIGFHGEGRAWRGLWMRRVITRSASMSSTRARWCTEALVHAAAEGQDGRWCYAG
jgi:hypothetical protein